jgi:hypothetical protein
LFRVIGRPGECDTTFLGNHEGGSFGNAFETNEVFIKNAIILGGILVKVTQEWKV